jgi:hypothetical protein
LPVEAKRALDDLRTAEVGTSDQRNHGVVGTGGAVQLLPCRKRSSRSLDVAREVLVIEINSHLSYDTTWTLFLAPLLSSWRPRRIELG